MPLVSGWKAFHRLPITEYYSLIGIERNGGKGLRDLPHGPSSQAD